MVGSELYPGYQVTIKQHLRNKCKNNFLFRFITILCTTALLADYLMYCSLKSTNTVARAILTSSSCSL